MAPIWRPVASRLLPRALDVVTICPPGPEVARRWTWLLHGRGATAPEIGQVLSQLGTAMALGQLAPRVVAAPYVPREGGGGSWWVDSHADDGLSMESAILQDVIPAVEAELLGGQTVQSRGIAGWSMGGGAALRWLRVRPDLFSSAALVAPAAYVGLPPLESSARTSGAFGEADVQWVEGRWRELMSLDFPAPPDSPELEVAIVAGDQEPLEMYETGPSSLTEQAARLHVALTGRGVRSHLRIAGGAHEQAFWAPALSTALSLLD